MIDPADLTSVEAGAEAIIKKHGSRLWADDSSSDEEGIARDLPPTNRDIRTQPNGSKLTSKRPAAEKSVAWTRNGKAAQIAKPLSGTGPAQTFTKGKGSSRGGAALQDRGEELQASFALRSAAHTLSNTTSKGRPRSSPQTGAVFFNVEKSKVEDLESGDADIIVQAPSDGEEPQVKSAKSKKPHPSPKNKTDSLAAESNIATSGMKSRSEVGACTRELKKEVRQHLSAGALRGGSSKAGGVKPATKQSHSRDDPVKGDEDEPNADDFEICEPVDVEEPAASSTSTATVKAAPADAASTPSRIKKNNKITKVKEVKVKPQHRTEVNSSVAKSAPAKTNPLGLSSIATVPQTSKPETTTTPSRRVITIKAPAGNDFNVTAPDDEPQLTIESRFKNLRLKCDNTRNSSANDDNVMSASQTVKKSNKKSSAM